MTPVHNDHNVYILGAGFSADRGLPLIPDFMLAVRDAHEWLVSNGRADEARSIEKVLDYRLRAASAAYRVPLDLENIEELFSLAAASTEKLTDDICTAIAATLDFRLSVRANPRMCFRAATTLPRPSHWTPEVPAGVAIPGADPEFKVPAYEYYLQALIGRLRDGSTVGENTFISFNYDTLVEEALSNLDLTFSYGFGTKSINYAPSFAGFRHDPNAALKVYKLHGSVNWARPGSQGRKLTVYRSYADFYRAKIPPIIVPPTWRKQFIGQLGDIWNGALKAIETATRLIVIGFSIPETDVHFKYLMAAGLQNNISLREILFVNPDRDTLLKRVESVFGANPSRAFHFGITGTRLDAFVSQQLCYEETYGRVVNRSLQNFGLQRS